MPVRHGELSSRHLRLHSNSDASCLRITDDAAAAQRSMVWQAAWWGDPVWFGDYPDSMKEALGDRLPTFTNEQKALLKGSADFWGMNHYTSKYARAMPAAGVARATPGW